MAVLRDLLKERERYGQSEQSRTFVIGAVFRSTIEKGGEYVWGNWHDTRDTYALVLAKSSSEALRQYLISRPDQAAWSKKEWSHDDKPAFMAGQREWSVTSFDCYPGEANTMVREPQGLVEINGVQYPFIRAY